MTVAAALGLAQLMACGGSSSFRSDAVNLLQSLATPASTLRPATVLAAATVRVTLGL